MTYTSVTFDRVFDIVRGQLNRQPVTWFGFQCGASIHCGVPAPGSPRIQEGDSVTVYLHEQGNWQKIVGWINMSTGEITMLPTFRGLIVFGGMQFIFSVVVSSMPLVVCFVLEALILAFGFSALQKTISHHRIRLHLLSLAKTTSNPALQRTASGGH